jgi:hypothetical protein
MTDTQQHEASRSPAAAAPIDVFSLIRRGTVCVFANPKAHQNDTIGLLLDMLKASRLRSTIDTRFCFEARVP